MSFPKFTVIEGQNGTSREVAGTLTSSIYGRENWVGDGWVGYLMADGKLFRGRWRLRGSLWAFTPESSIHCREICNRREWDVLDGYWGGRAQIVLDMSRQWRRTRFEPSDAISFEGAECTWMGKATEASRASSDLRLYPARTQPSGTQPTEGEGEIISGGWDHEHCVICWQKISPTTQTEGYVSLPSTWICLSCYSQFVRPRSLGFIPTI